MNEQRIYVVVAGTIQVPVSTYIHNGKVIPDLHKGVRTVVQPAGRQIAQACHAVSKLRFHPGYGPSPGRFEPMTTIILQARDSAEMGHVHKLLFRRKLKVTLFSDQNEQAYGPGWWPTSLAIYATKKQVDGILDYLPLWGAQ